MAVYDLFEEITDVGRNNPFNQAETEGIKDTVTSWMPDKCLKNLALDTNEIFTEISPTKNKYLKDNYVGRGKSPRLNQQGFSSTLSVDFGSGSGYLENPIEDYQKFDKTGVISFWIKTVPGLTSGTIFSSKQGVGGDKIFEILLDANGPNSTPGIRVDNGTTEDHITSGSGRVGDGRWHHVIIFANTIGSWEILVDLTSFGFIIKAGGNNGRWFNFVPDRDNITFGAQVDTGPTVTKPLDAKIDEFSIWNGLTTGKLIAGLYNNGIPGDLFKLNESEGGLVGWWGFGDGVGDGAKIADQIGGIDVDFKNGLTGADIVKDAPPS